MTKDQVLDRLRAINASGKPTPPAWLPAWFLLSGFTVRMEMLGTLSPTMDESLTALASRLLDGGDPV